MADIFKKWRDSLTKTRNVAFGRLASFFGATQIDDDSWDELEAMLIQADMGMDTTQEIIKQAKTAVKTQGLTKTEQLAAVLKQTLTQRLQETPTFTLSAKPTVIMLVGVNGSGKTTSAAKLGWQFKQQGKKVLLVAADTYRAAAVDQLKVWADRLGLPLISGQDGADPGAITYDGIQAGIARGVDIVIVDTAGRLHTRYNLMEEIKKVAKVANKSMPGAPHYTWLVLDATTGQNAMQQAISFKEAVRVNAVILSKLDSSAKGGMAFAVHEQLKLPIVYAGLGEKPEDLEQFNRDAFVDGILASPNT